ncbi:hypothetical protein HanHA300_Chr17g0671201 [Helianthus annuus]|nr:hypothetical protein HanHA300_Chr17g0671201 [Helianthus annuus]KAJ0633945.1 hypothetical protein HanLR1_Chr17g0682531 [Helianthus annuus]
MEGLPTSPPAGAYSNGHHNNQNGTTQTDHLKSWKSHSGGARSRSRVPREVDAPPCTDFDKAYFQSYSHVGIHEEMIKAALFDFDLYLCYWFGSPNFLCLELKLLVIERFTCSIGYLYGDLP